MGWKFLFLIASIIPLSLGELEDGLTWHFNDWLETNGYKAYNFNRYDITDSAFGGKYTDNEEVTREPIIFIHGLTDVALGGFSTLIEHFLEKGYLESEIYATTWGMGGQIDADDEYFRTKYLIRLRKFVEAVLKYTGAEKVDIVAHSMGVTLARAITKGGLITAAQTPVDLGPPLTDQVDTFVALAAGAYGMEECIENLGKTKMCNSLNGYYPGIGEGPIGLSYFLQMLNDLPTREANHVFALHSAADEVDGDMMYDKHSGLFPTVDDQIYFTDHTHGDLVWGVNDEVFSLVNDHVIP